MLASLLLPLQEGLLLLRLLTTDSFPCFVPCTSLPAGWSVALSPSLPRLRSSPTLARAWTFDNPRPFLPHKTSTTTALLFLNIIYIFVSGVILPCHCAKISNEPCVSIDVTQRTHDALLDSSASTRTAAHPLPGPAWPPSILLRDSLQHHHHQRHARLDVLLEFSFSTQGTADFRSVCTSRLSPPTQTRFFPSRGR